ncbi:hypothetical protein DYB28_012827 [Aphanomyces astaci]|uniref:tRNA (guanine(9)-N(1))-methyltransferase n=1 Tax=Aphanomyces astaci TaxID=112090 RepID=A0A397C721_APHAT|nr:hypothetical protein DYB34_006393 [Aphanomyces astaci]RHY37522.1 hypothetical protein DYB25_000113 [Aphanomyces astaci]RLO03434.1 hypothetical protein DYB28_012827 [Aphanomyces astaci]
MASAIASAASEMDGHDKETEYEAKMVKKTVLARERRKMRRKELLGSMTADERKAFVKNEAQTEQERAQRLAVASETGQRVAIDCGYDGIMSDKEVSSLSKQIKFCYGTIRRMDDPFALTVTDCTDGSRIASALQRFSADKWSIQLQPASDLVFLTPDSPNLLSTLDRSKVYGRSLQAATALGVETARLPIQEFVPDRHTDHILNVNTVVEILASIQAGNDWPTTLAECLPKVL